MKKTRGLRAILRRLFFIPGLLIGLTMALWPRPIVYRVRATDFTQHQRNRSRWDESRNLPLDEYIGQTTAGRVLGVKGQAWAELLNRCRSAQNGILLPPEKMPWDAEVAARAGDFTYVHVQRANGDAYMDVTAIGPSDHPPVPAKLRYPLRRAGLWVLLVVSLTYAFVPWSGAAPATLSYLTFRGVVLPDLLGTIIVALFYALPWLIVPSTTGHSWPVTGGMLPLTVVLWAFVLPGMVFFWISARTEAWCLGVGENVLRLTTISGMETIPFDQIEHLKGTPAVPPRALTICGWLISLISWRAAGPTLLMSARSDTYIQIRLADGTSRRFVRTCLRNVNVLVEACREAGVTTEIKG